MQLDLCLNTIKQNLQLSCQIFVLYDCDPEYEQAYQGLRHHWEGVQFWRQNTSLFQDIDILLKTCDTKYTGFLTDDCFVYRKSFNFSDQVLDEIFDALEVGCISLRLGLNTDTRSHENATWKEPLMFMKGLNILKGPHGLIAYDRTQHLFGGYWNYPLSVDGHIFQTTKMIEWVRELRYLEPIKNWKNTPNAFEQALQRFLYEVGPLVVINEESCIVNSPNNRVQNHIENSNGLKHNISEKDLLREFYAGHRIKLDKLDVSNIRCAHTEINLMEGLEWVE